MPRDVWQQAIEHAPVPERGRHAFSQQREAGTLPPSLSVEDARVWCALWSGSEWAAELLRQHPEWQPLLTAEKLSHSPSLAGLRRELDGLLAPLAETGSHASAVAVLRRFKQREMIRIAARDLARLAPTVEIIQEISAIADLCLSALLELSLRQFCARFGSPFEQSPDGQWRETSCCIIGVGKLGGQELNYSSDVDVLFVYSDEGGVFKQAPRKNQSAKPVLSNHQFFTRLAEFFIAEVSRLTGDGMLYRIDLRLRPEGNAGPLVRSLASYETYYAQWGQTWERMMLIKARGVAGDSTLAGEFIEMTQPFRYPRSLSANVLREVAATKQRIEQEVLKSGELDRNVKLGRGGIREIEFTTQALQLLHAGRNPFLQTPQTLPALQKLAHYGALPNVDAEALSRAYTFLRDTEHRLQMEQNLQTHLLPESATARARIARLMGFENWSSFERARANHAKNVRRVYERLLQAAPAAAEQRALPEWDANEGWESLLRQHSFLEPARAARLLREFALGPGYGHVSERTSTLAGQLVWPILDLCPRNENRRTRQQSILSDPDRVVARLDSFVAAYGARAMLFETWSSNTALFDLMLLLFDRSEFLAEVAIRTPDLVEALVLSGHLQKRKAAEAVLAELRHGSRDADQLLWLRRYHQSELMRIGLRDILGLADYEKNFEELSALAEACLGYALEIVMRRRRLKAAPFAIIGWGKLGGAELNYGSDLDITFVAPDTAKKLPRLQPLAVELMDLLSSPTELGVAFITDARLRPDGEKGLLVNTLSAQREYYQRRAALWEIQSLTRTRFIAGDERTGSAFIQLATELTNFSKGGHAFAPDWKQQMAAMRARIETERTPRGHDALAIKTGPGGLMDAEFLAQGCALERGWHEPNTLRALRRAQAEGALKPTDATKLIENYRRLRRVEAILRRWSFAGETVLPTDPAPLYRVAVRCGFSTAEEFMAALARWRRAIREVFAKVFAA